MSGSDWMVVAAGLGAIAWVNWYFFFAGRSAAAVAPAVASDRVAEVPVEVQGGYTPAVIRVKAGVPVRLVFERRDPSSCAEEVVFPDFGIRRFLPMGQKTRIEITPPGAGTYEFMCGMSMLRGTLIAE